MGGYYSVQPRHKMKTDMPEKQAKKLNVPDIKP